MCVILDMSRKPDCFRFFFREDVIDFDTDPPNSLKRKTESASTPSVFINALTPFNVPLDLNKKGKLIRILLHIRSKVLDKGFAFPLAFVRLSPFLNLVGFSLAYGFGNDIP